MDNDQLAAKCHLPEDTRAQPSAPGTNGILGRTQGQYVSSAIFAMPPAISLAEQHQEIEMGAGPDGRVRIFAEKRLSQTPSALALLLIGVPSRAGEGRRVA
jgi:hypothetical protein